MSWLGIVEARVLRFKTVDGAIEAKSFGPDFGNEVTGDVSLKASGVVGFLDRENVTVNERSDGVFMHDG